MNIENIQVGQILAYKKLCELLAEPYHRTGGNVKEKQLENWSRYFEWEKVGLKFKVTTIYDKPKAEIIKPRNSKFVPIICHLLMMQMKDRYIITSENELLTDLFMMSPDFAREYKQNKNFNDTAFHFIKFELSKRLDSALKSLIKREIIKLDIHNVKVILNKSMVLNGSYLVETEIMTDEENERYKKVIEESIWEYQHRHNRCSLTSLSTIWFECGMNEYMKIRNEMIDKEFGCRVKKEYHIEVLTDNKIYNLDQELQGMSERELLSELNTRLNDSILKTLETKLNKDVNSPDYQRHYTAKDRIKELVELNRIHEEQRTITQSEIDELETVYKDCVWDNDDTVMPDERFEMYESKHKNKKKRKCLEDYE